MDQEYLRKIKEEHAELGYKVSHLRRLVAARDDLAGLQKSLTSLKAELKEHFAIEEDGGYFSEVVAVAPRLQHRAQQLADEHADLMTQIERLAAQAEDSDESDSWWAKFATASGDFVAALINHERGENSLVQEAYDRDIGDKD